MSELDYLAIGDNSGVIMLKAGFLENCIFCNNELLAKQQTYLSPIN